MTSIINRINRINTVISENIDDLIFILNEKFVCEYVNFQDIKETFHINDFIHPQDSKNLTKFIQNTFNLGQDTAEARIKSDSVQYRWYEIAGKLIVESDNKKVILICHDITKYKYYEKEFKQSQIRYSQLADSLPEIKYWKLIQSKEGIAAVQKASEMLELVINNIPQFIYWKDKALVFMGSNSNFAKVNGFENPTSIIGRKGSELDWIRDKNAYIDDCERKIMARNTPEFNVIEPLITSEGNQAWFAINRIPLLDAKDKVVGILVTYEDITDRKKSEQNLKKSEEKYRGILDNIKETYFEVDLDGTFTFFNDSFIELIGYERDELMGANFEKFVDEENKEKIKNTYSQVLKTEKPKSVFQFQFHNKKGKAVTCESSIYLRYDTNGQCIGFSGIARDITEDYMLEQKLKESEEELRVLNEKLEQIVYERTRELKKSEEKFRHLYKNSPYGIVLLNSKGTIEDINSTIPLMFGYDREDLIGRNYSTLIEIYPSNTKDALRELPDLLSQKGALDSKVIPKQVQIFKKDGTTAWVQSEISTIELGDEIIIQFIIQDITEKTIAEEKLRESERQYRTTIDSLGDPLHVVDKNLNIILVNKEFENWLDQLNMSRDIWGRKLSDIFPFLPTKVYEEYNQVFENGITLISAEETSLAGREVITETRKIPIFHEGGVEQIITIVRDITEREEMETQLIESEEKYRNMVNYLDVAFYKGVYQDKLIMHNQAANRILGLKPEDSLVGVQPSQMFIDPEAYNKYYKDLEEKGFVRNFIAQVKKPNEEVITLNLNAHVIYDSEGKAIEVEGTFTDITEKFILEQELMESEKKLREQNLELMKLDEIKNDFITMAAHELKTPLISISGYTDYILMKHKNFLTPQIIGDLKTVQRNVKRLEVLMDQLFEVMKIDEDKLKLQKEYTNVSTLINDCLDELSYLINEKNLEIKLDINHEIMLNVDTTRIFTVFTNLISNAIKFTQEYGLIEISAKKIDDGYTFKVKDNGIGLAEEELGKLFKKFERLHQVNRNENITIKDSGTGLGLYITKGIVDAHGGKISATSEGEDKGSSFIFTLPS